MSKKIIALIVCGAIIAVGAIATGVYFIGYSTGKKTAQSSDGGQEISEPVCAMSDFKLFDSAVDSYATKEGFGASYLQKNFAMPAEDANDLVEHPENWLCFQTYFSIKNTDIDELSIFGVNCDNNGKNGVYIFTGTTEVYTIPKKGSYVLCVPVLYRNNEMSTEEAREALGVLNATVRYGAYFDPDDCVNYNAPITLE